MSTPKVLIEVGAHTGNDVLIERCRRSGDRFYMFEPTPSLAAGLERRCQGAPSLRVIPAAVSNYNGHARFHIASRDDCSSLQTFAPDAAAAWAHPWLPNQRFEMVDEVDVEVVRLDDFLAREGVERVDWLEIDAQGEDLRVVESLGDRVRDVRKIQIEVSIHTSPLYANAFTRAEAVAFFAARGFEPHISWRQSMNREENIIFRNRRFYPNPLVNAVVAGVEQAWTSTRIAWSKLPRFLAVTKMIWFGKGATNQ